MSTLDVVAEVLREVAPRALCAKQIVELATGRLPTASRTPETVVSRDLAIDVRDKETKSRFLRVDRGEFVLKEALPTAFYSDNDPYVAQWTRNLIAAGQIAAGVVDERSIRDLRPADVASYRQCHFFAGVGTWSRALRDAGWPDDVNVWSGSCPCQPLSQAGRRLGFADDRHLWPEWFRLIAACRPSVIFAEQVASKDGRTWLDLVLADLEGADYACRPFDLPAASVGGSHARQRLYLVAYARERGREVVGAPWLHDRGQSWYDAARCSAVDGGDAGAVPDAAVARRVLPQDAGADRGDAGAGTEAHDRRAAGDLELERGGADDGAGAVSDAERVMRDEGWIGGPHGRPEIELDRYGEADGAGCGCIGTIGVGDAGLPRGGRDAGALPRTEGVGEGEWIEARDLADEPVAPGAAFLDREDVWNGAVRGYWAHANWIYCRPAPGYEDGRWRPVEPVVVKMAPGASAPLGSLRPEEVEDVDTAETDAAKILRSLWPQDGAEANQWKVGRFGRVQAAEVLRSALHGRLDGREDQSSECEELAAAEREAGGEVLFPLRSFRQTSLRAPSRRESAQQRPVELEDLVRLLSSSIAFAELRSDNGTAEALQALLESCGAERLVSRPSWEAPKVWRSIADTDKSRFLVGLGGFRRASISPLIKYQGKINNRASRLRGYGNSIVLPLATMFVAAVIDAFADAARGAEIAPTVDAVIDATKEVA